MRRASNLQRIFLALIFSSVILLPSCRKEPKEKINAESEGVGKYTFRTVLPPPSTLSPTDCITASETFILNLISSPMYSVVMDLDGEGSHIECELASDLPSDVTLLYAGKKPYGIPSGAKEGYAWKIQLREDAVWEDGSPINSETVEYSLMQFLSPSMKNFRASDFYDKVPIANAGSYVRGNELYDDIFNLETKKYAPVPEHEMYVSLSRPVAFFGDSVETYRKSYAEKFTDDDGNDIYGALKELCGNEVYAPLTENMKPLLLKIARSFGDTNPEAYKEFCFRLKKLPSTSWEDVGFIKNNERTFTLILKSPVSRFTATSLNIPLLYKPLYEANKRVSGGLVKSSYGSSRENIASYGPYLISGYLPGKSIRLERNERWYGWSDGKHGGQYMTTGFDIMLTEDRDEAKRLFDNGMLDEIKVPESVLGTYHTGVSIKKSPSPYTCSLSLNSDRKSLSKRERPGVNKTILSCRDFRHALSLCIDREKFVEEISPSSSPEHTLINASYMGDAESGKTYRKTDGAKSVLEKITRADDAKACLEKSYAEALEDGLIHEGDIVELEMHVDSDTPVNRMTADFIRDSISKAAEGTVLENRIEIVLVPDPDFLSSVKKGLSDLALTKRGDESLNPCGLLALYCGRDSLFEYGFDPASEKMEIEIGGEKISRTLPQWLSELEKGKYASASPSVKNMVLSEIEIRLLESYCVIPLRSMNSVRLISPRVREGSQDFVNHEVGFGGVRFLSYTKDDSSL